MQVVNSFSIYLEEYSCFAVSCGSALALIIVMAFIGRYKIDSKPKKNEPPTIISLHYRSNIKENLQTLALRHLHHTTIKLNQKSIEAIGPFQARVAE